LWVKQGCSTNWPCGPSARLQALVGGTLPLRVEASVLLDKFGVHSMIALLELPVAPADCGEREFRLVVGMPVWRMSGQGPPHARCSRGPASR